MFFLGSHLAEALSEADVRQLGGLGYSFQTPPPPGSQGWLSRFFANLGITALARTITHVVENFVQPAIQNTVIWGRITVIRKISYIVQGLFIAMMIAAAPFVGLLALIFTMRDPSTGPIRILDYFFVMLWIYSWWFPWLFVDKVLFAAAQMSHGPLARYAPQAGLTLYIIGPAIMALVIRGGREGIVMFMAGIAQGTASALSAIPFGQLPQLAAVARGAVGAATEALGITLPPVIP